MLRKILISIVLLISFTGITCEDTKKEKPVSEDYIDDPLIISMIKKLGDSSFIALPLNMKTNKWVRIGKRTADYSMRMLYNPESESALYVGGNHNNGRRNNCWEYHLGSNTWKSLFSGDGGDHYFMKNAVMFGMREYYKKIKKNKDLPQTMETFKKMSRFKKPKDMKVLTEKLIPWWKKYIIIHRGYMATVRGGPIMPSHTWDGVCYDQTNKRLVWVGGAGQNPNAFHALVHGISKQELDLKMNASRVAYLKKIGKDSKSKYSPAWFFDPYSKEWSRDLIPVNGSYPKLRGMGQSVNYIPDTKELIWYVAVDNVSPGSYAMWSFDCTKQSWQQIKPNGNKGIRHLANKEKIAPKGEIVIRYNSKDKKLVAFAGPSVFSYDIKTKIWEKICEDKRIDAHDAKVAIAYDSKNNVFIYTRQRVKKGQVQLAIFSPQNKKWETPNIAKGKFPFAKWSQFKGYYHPKHNVMVLHANEKVFLYRYKN